MNDSNVMNLKILVLQWMMEKKEYFSKKGIFLVVNEIAAYGHFDPINKDFYQSDLMVTIRFSDGTVGFWARPYMPGGFQIKFDSYDPKLFEKLESVILDYKAEFKE